MNKEEIEKKIYEDIDLKMIDDDKIVDQLVMELADSILKNEQLQKESKKQNEMLDILKWYLKSRQEDLLNTVSRGLGYYSYGLLKEWLENN